MTHVAHPFVQRIGVNRDWRSRWFATDKKRFREYLRVDAAIRRLLAKRLKGMSADVVEIERDEKAIRIIIKSARPGLVIGRSGEGATKLKKDIDQLLRTLKLTEKPEIKIDIEEIRSPELSAQIVGQMVAEGLEKRIQFRRVLKQTIEKVMANRDVQGVRIMMSGRLGGADMSRVEELKKGRIPLQTLRADIDFSRVRANLPYGVIGIKVWIYRGDVFVDRRGGTNTNTQNGREGGEENNSSRAPRRPAGRTRNS